MDPDDMLRRVTLTSGEWEYIKTLLVRDTRPDDQAQYRHALIEHVWDTPELISPETGEVINREAK